MDAVALALLSAFLFGAMTVVLRLALVRSPNAERGALITVAVALLVVMPFVVVRPPAELDLGQVGLFALAGLLAPGGSQLLFTLAVRDAGAARVSAVTGAAPLVAVATAFLLLDEPFRLPLVAGAALIVIGGGALAGERIRPAHFKAVGLLFAAAGATLFALRDNVVRSLSEETVVTSFAGTAITLISGGLLILVYLLRKQGSRALAVPWREAAGFLPAGLLQGLSYLCLFEAFYRGRVSVVSPLVATESLWGVGLAALVLRGSELVGRRLVAGAVLIVLGGILIGAFR